MLKKIGLFSPCARANAASPHGCQSIGLSACCRRYSEGESARRFGIFVTLPVATGYNGNMARKADEWPPKPNLSRSSMGIYEGCRRQWALQYMSDFVAPEIRETVKRQARLMPLGTLAGQVVDDVITTMLREYKETQKWREDSLFLAKQIIRQYIQYTQAFMQGNENADLGFPKRQPLFPYFYGEKITPEEQKQILERIELCLTNFLDSDLRVFLEAAGTESWRVQEHNAAVPWFSWEEIPLYAKYDFALLSDERATIFDWKTGDPVRGEADARWQLHWYAVYVHEAWGIPLENIQLCAFWLRAGTAWRDGFMPLNSAILEDLKGKWRKTIEDIRAKWNHVQQSPKADQPRILWTEFPWTEQYWRCRDCKFHVCEGRARVKDLPARAPREVEEDN